MNDSSALTVAQLINYAAEEFEQHELFYGHGTDNPQDEAFYLVFAYLGFTFDSDDSVYQSIVSLENIEKIQDLVKQRCEQHIPIAYLVSKAWFAGLEFQIDERALIPRSPFAELIIQGFAPWCDIEQIESVLEIGTGSGCMSIALAHYFPHLKIDAVDIDEDALALAELNRQKHKLTQQVSFYQSDVFSGLPQKQYDLIISNPPYVPDTEMQTLPEEYLQEPQHALRANDNGLKIVNEILFNARGWLNDSGKLFVEVGNSDEIVAETYPQIPFTWLEFESGGHGVFVFTKQELAEYF